MLVIMIVHKQGKVVHLLLFCFASQSNAKDELEGKSKQEQMECLRNQTDDDDIQFLVDKVTALLEEGTTPEEINPVGFGL